MGAKLQGDDQLAKGEIKEATIEMAAIKKAQAEMKGQLSAQAGMINKTMTDMRNTDSGRDSIMNDPKMIEKLMYTFGIVIGMPFLGLLFIMAIYILSSERRHRLTNQNFAALIEAIHNDPELKTEA